MILLIYVTVLGICLMQLLVESRGPHHPRGEVTIKHTHYRPTKNSPQKITQDAELLHDKEHLEEHLDEVIDQSVDLSKLTNEELEFYYFQVHDTDKNSKLDGLEILQAIIHTVHGNNEDSNDKQEAEIENDFHYYVEIIDRALNEDDIDQDGYLSYPEFASARKKTLTAENETNITNNNDNSINDEEVAVEMIP